MATTAPAVTLADLVPVPSTRLRAALRVVALVGGFALLTAVAAQVTFRLPWTPVPITGQTFAVLLCGATLGSRLGASSQGLYVLLGLVFPFYADGQRGWTVATGATGGYLVGFVIAAALVGLMAERRQDRTLLGSLPAMLTGTAVIYLCGVWWLARHLGVDAAEAMRLGMVPFVIGDLVKLTAAGLLLPAAWRLAERGRRDGPAR